MSERLHPGTHLDADRISAFMEGALTEAEREESLAHLAECSECRDIVFLAQQAVPVADPQPAALPAWRRWMPPLSLAAGAVACGLIVILWMRPHPAPRSAANSIEVARQAAAPLPPVAAAKPETAPPPASPVLTRQATVANRPERSKLQAPAAAPADSIVGIAGANPGQRAQPAAKQVQPAAAMDQAQTALPASGRAPIPPAGGQASGSATAGTQLAPNTGAATEANPAGQLAARSAMPIVNGALVEAPRQNAFLAASSALHLIIEHNHGPDNGFSAILGTVTDPSGAVLPHASVTLRRASGETAGTATTDRDGRFSLSSVAPGEYQLQISAPGFMTDTERLNLEARDLALLTPALRIGAETQTVEVAAESNAIAPTPVMTDAQLAAIVPVLPGKAAATTTVVKNGRMLALDASGMLYLSRDAGRHWKRIRPVWTGAIIHLVVSSETASSDLKTSKKATGNATALFELTTSDGAVWVSNDGAHWRLR